ncbi:RN19A ligase, partial [Alectura lathami]|nr:RN19A ligase [Alectura lathami]
EGLCSPTGAGAEPRCPVLPPPSQAVSLPLPAEAEDIKVCPRCSACAMKINDGSCNRVSCAVCSCLFCWLCLQEVSDVRFLSPSGCTVWGKRPWSRTRKILWQLGTVLGAPMVISLVAGIAVIVIGLPIYAGRKALALGRRSSVSGCQQCVSVTGGVLLSLFVSPIVTAVTAGIGVPLVLPYVCGAVVLSRCR